jgi:hypothetical protein
MKNYKLYEKYNNKENFETFFSYGHMRANYLGSGIKSGNLNIEMFIRPKYIFEIKKNIILDSKVFKECPNTYLQSTLSPISRQFLWEIQSGIMIRLLENITNETNLIPDTHCKQSKLEQNPTNKLRLENWHDPDTNLKAALVLGVSLDNGSAFICKNPSSLGRVSIDSPHIITTYWQSI